MKNPRAGHIWNSCRSHRVGHCMPLLGKLMWSTQLCGLELHWGPSAKPGSTEVSLASLPHQLSDSQKAAEACIGLMGKITARASPVLETCACAAAQPIPSLRKRDKTTAVGESTYLLPPVYWCWSVKLSYLCVGFGPDFADVHFHTDIPAAADLMALHGTCGDCHRAFWAAFHSDRRKSNYH